ncbi:MAG: hypothetical protein ACOCX2_15100, partial [Armatimonadota bacterium]
MNSRQQKTRHNLQTSLLPSNSYLAVQKLFMILACLVTGSSCTHFLSVQGSTGVEAVRIPLEQEGRIFVYSGKGKLRTVYPDSGWSRFTGGEGEVSATYHTAQMHPNQRHFV